MIDTISWIILIVLILHILNNKFLGFGAERNFKKALKLRKKLEEKGKEVKIFLADNINIEELENYGIESWVNTACPALTFDSRVLNINEIKN